METFEQEFNIKVNSPKKGHIALNEIEQNLPQGDNLAVAFNDYGEMRVFLISRVSEEVERLNVNKLCNFDDRSKPIEGQMHPMVTCCFNHAGNLFVQALYRPTQVHYHFEYSVAQKAMIGSQAVQVDVFESTTFNFPLKSFYSETR